MRYFDFVLKTNSEQIEKNAKIRLKEYDYQSLVAAMNNYMYKNMKNGICYFAYREEGDAVLTAFSYDEKKGSFRDAYDYIFEMLNEIFSIKKLRLSLVKLQCTGFMNICLRPEEGTIFPITRE